MSAITPQTQVRLVKCPIEKDNRNQINFADTTAQYNYFNSLTHLEVENFTYQRKDSIIRYPDHIDNLLGYNYVMYKNNGYSNKWFYAFITNMEYVNDKMTHITIKTDVFQTWQFDLVYKKSFIEREHVNDDTVGKHTVPEGLETGEYVVRDSGVLDYKSPTPPVFSGVNAWSIVMAVTLDDDLFPNISSVYYGGCFSGTVYIEFSGIYTLHAGLFIKAMNAQAKLEAITSIFMLPTITLDTTPYTFSVGSTPITCGLLNSTDTADEMTFGVGNKPTTIGTYTPRNKKLLTSDYCYLLFDNGVGGTKKYNFEDFDTITGTYQINFDYISTPTPSGSVVVAPRNYKGVTQNLLESFAGGKFPMCSWASDPYTNWLTQSGVNRSFNYGTDALQTIAGAGITGLGLATGNLGISMYGLAQLGSGIGETIGDIKEDIKQRKQHQIAPNELSGNESLGDVAFAHFRCIPKYYYMSIKEEYAKIIDSYFDIYGYQVNEVKLPNVTGRTNWNYVKTINVNLEGDIPETDLQEIKNIFNGGFTIWHNPSKYLDYSQSNAIV